MRFVRRDLDILRIVTGRRRRYGARSGWAAYFLVWLRRAGGRGHSIALRGVDVARELVRSSGCRAFAGRRTGEELFGVFVVGDGEFGEAEVLAAFAAAGVAEKAAS